MTTMEDAEKEIKMIDQMFLIHKKLKVCDRSKLLEMKRKIVKEQIEIMENKYLSEEVLKKNESK